MSNQNITNETARESVLRYIGSRFDEGLLSVGTYVFDTPQVAMEILEYIEGRTVGLNPDGYLAFRGSDDLTEAVDDAIGALQVAGVQIATSASELWAVRSPQVVAAHLRHLADLIGGETA